MQTSHTLNRPIPAIYTPIVEIIGGSNGIQVGIRNQDEISTIVYKVQSENAGQWEDVEILSGVTQYSITAGQSSIFNFTPPSVRSRIMAYGNARAEIFISSIREDGEELPTVQL